MSAQFRLNDVHDSDDEELDEDELGQSSDESQEEEGVSSENEDEDEPALDDLQNFISTLDPASKKRKATGAPEIEHNADLRSRKRRLIKERTEAGAENEFRAQASGSKLNLDDLLAPLSSQSSALASLKKSTKALAPSSSKTKTLSAPLPERIQQRLDREAAYEQTKGEVDKWAATMKRIREAEHLSFPLQSQPAGRVSNLELAAKFKPTTALESSVDALLKSAKMREEDLQHTEDGMLQANKLSVEEVAQRRGELRKMRELMFRAEVKAKRVGKIKSKTYRKLKRKEKERLGEKLDEGESESEEGRLKREVERARERATLKHKHTGKWAKQMKGKQGLGEDARRDIEDMLERGERLRRKIKGTGSDSDDDKSGDDDDMDADEQGGVDGIKQGAFDELARMDVDEGNIGIGNDGKGKSIFEMKFMKDAMARQKAGADRMVDDFIKEMGGQQDDDDSEKGTNDIDSSSGVITQRTGGRVSYHPGASDSRRIVRPLGSLASDTSSVTLKSTDLLSPPPPSPQQQRRPTVPLPSTEESNPWLVPQDPDAARKISRKKNEVVVGKDSGNIEKSKNKLKKLAKKREEEKEKAKDDAVIEISMTNILSVAGSSKPSAKTRNTTTGDGGDDSDINSEVEDQEKMQDYKGKNKAKGLKAFEQRDLVALAFAGDNVVQEFEQVKQREIAADAPREVDTTIPGWGSWGGSGTRRAPPKPHLIKKIPGIDPSTRADFNKKHIIISEKRDKKAAKYLVKDLPYPYTSKAQFERSMERPIGAEWNTRVAFQRGTLPKVVKKMGAIINPLEKLT